MDRPGPAPRALVTLRQGRGERKKKVLVQRLQPPSFPFGLPAQSPVTIFLFSRKAVALSACQVAVKTFGHEYS